MVDEATALPDGTVLELVIDDGGDELGTDEHRALRTAITRSLEQASEGKVAPAEEILARVRARRGR